MSDNIPAINSVMEYMETVDIQKTFEQQLQDDCKVAADAADKEIVEALFANDEPWICSDCGFSWCECGHYPPSADTAETVAQTEEDEFGETVGSDPSVLHVVTKSGAEIEVTKHQVEYMKRVHGIDLLKELQGLKSESTETPRLVRIYEIGKKTP